MKKLFGIFAAMLLVALAACNNTQVPYRELADAVKAANEKVQEFSNPNVQKISITYDEITNTVKFEAVMPGEVNINALQANAADIKRGFVEAMVQNDEHDLCNPIINAKSNVELIYGGTSGKPFEILIESQEIADAKAALIEE